MPLNLLRPADALIAAGMPVDEEGLQDEEPLQRRGSLDGSAPTSNAKVLKAAEAPAAAAGHDREAVAYPACMAAGVTARGSMHMSHGALLRGQLPLHLVPDAGG